MKIAAGCFGCLALFFFSLAVAWGFIVAAIMPMVATDPSAAEAFGTLAAYGNYLNGSCCCLSSLLAIVLLVVGMRKGDGEMVE